MTSSSIRQVIVVDIRGHGRSAFTGSAKVEDLAKDLREIIEEVKPTNLTCIGSSMGAAILWSYCEQYDNEGIARGVFVDQAPLQYEKPGWTLGSKGLRTEKDLGNLKRALGEDMRAFAAGNADCCLVSPTSIDSAFMDLITEETLLCDPTFLGELMTDHTAIDWRDLLRDKYRIPVLNFAGGKSDIFPVEGVATINSLLDTSQTPNKLEVFEDCSHWLYIERPKDFMRLVVSFAAGQ